MIGVVSSVPNAPLSVEEVIRDVTHLPCAPKVLPRLKRLLTDGNSAMHDIVGLIRLDPGIAARVLHVSNSAYFNPGEACTTVDEAVARVGYNHVYELVSYAVATQVIVRSLDVYGIQADDLWRMSVACAIAAEVLADRTQQDRQVAYTLGLLHGVGMVAIDEWALRQRPGLQLARGEFPREASDSEREVLGFTQADAGAALLLHWEFPETMCEPVKCQYTPLRSAKHARMACLLYLAKWIRSTVCAGSRATPLPMPEAVFLQPLGLNSAALSALMNNVSERLSTVTSLLGANEGQVIERQLFPAQSWRG